MKRLLKVICLAVPLIIQCCCVLVESCLVSAQDLMVSSTSNTTRVDGTGAFHRECRYTGDDTSSIYLEWWHNGTLLVQQRLQSNMPLTFTISEVRLQHSGEYVCRARRGNSVISCLSAGFLNVYDLTYIDVPANQSVVAGFNIDLECSSHIPRTITTWRKANGFSLPSARLYNVTLEYRGMYTCSIIETLGSAVIYMSQVFLEVIVPPTIVTVSIIKEVYTNEPETLLVSFLSSFESDTTVTWLKENILFMSQPIQTSYENQTAGNTSVHFPQLNRVDNGRYTVKIENSRDNIPDEKRRVEVTFTLLVRVPPSRPTKPSIHTHNNTFSTITWNLTNQTVDAGPDTLILNIQNTSVSLNPLAEEYILRTKPGINYAISITAINRDGMSMTDPAYLRIPPAAPFVTSLILLRLNETTFNISVEVLYIGAGSGGLLLYDIMFRERGTSDPWIQFGTTMDLVSSPYSSQSWYLTVTNSQFAPLKVVEFSLNVRNTVFSNGVHRTVVQTLVVPGPPEKVTVISSSSNSLTLQTRLSTTGTAPLLSVHLVITGPGNTSSTINVTENIYPGGLVIFEVRGLSSATSYSVLCYATNAAGRGEDSPVNMEVSTSPAISNFPILIILIIAVVLVGSVIIAIFMLLVISRCCKRHNDGKIDLSSLPPSYSHQDARPGTIGGSSTDSIHASSNHAYSQKSYNGFLLSPPPTGLMTPRSPTTTSSIGAGFSPFYNYTAPQPLGSISDIDASVEQPSKYRHFNFHHSPTNTIEKMELSRSMLDLDEPDISPTMPPNCATDV